MDAPTVRGRELRARRRALPVRSLTLDDLSKKLSLDATVLSRIEREEVKSVHPFVLREWLRILRAAEQANARRNGLKTTS